MAKISPVAAKYIIHSTITIDGVVDRPDVIGAIFGQTEGLLGNDLELRELQRSGRIGRIEVNTNTTSGKTKGEIIIPSSLDKTETAIVAAALEIIQRIGPCNAKILVDKIEDVRTSKRQFVIERAKELLRELTDTTLPDSQELSDEVAQSVRMMEVGEYGKDRLAAGPMIEESDEIIIVEGRADVLNLLKHGFKNAIAMNGTSCPPTIRELCSRKTVTMFVDGDRGGDLIVRELLSVAEIDFVCKAPDGKEVEELAKKEIHKGLRSRITAEQAKLDLGIDSDGALKVDDITLRQQHFVRQPRSQQTSQNGNHNGPQHRQERGPDNARMRETGNGLNRDREGQREPSREQSRELNREQPAMGNPRFPAQRGPTQQSVQEGGIREDGPRPNAEEKKKLKATMEDLFGTRGACIFDQKLNILGKVPLSEVSTTIKSLNGGVYALAVDGAIDSDLVKVAEKVGVSVLVGTGNKVKESSKVALLTDDQL